MIYDVTLTLIDKIGPKSAALLIEAFGTAERIITSSREELLQAGLSPLLADTLINSRESALQRATAITEQCQRSGIAILVKGSEHYSRLLAECSDAPHVLYVRGYVNFNAGKWVSVVGTRKATPAGMTQASMLVADIAHSYPDAVIVSGLAFGIDKAAHVAALENGLKTVAVMAGWVDDITPRAHYAIARKILNDNGAVVSDMPPETTIAGGNFLSRNRIIAGLSHATFVVESAARGGSLVTADIALSYDRELFALPGRVEDIERQGTNALIKSNKAVLYQDISDLAQAMNWRRATFMEQNPSSLPEKLRQTYQAIPEAEPFTLDVVCDALGIVVSEASSRIIQLEVRGFVKSIQGRMYQKAKF